MVENATKRIKKSRFQTKMPRLEEVCQILNQTPGRSYPKWTRRSRPFFSFSLIYMICDMWHNTRDMWHATCIMLWGCTFFQNVSSLVVMVWKKQCLEHISKEDHTINYKAVFKTAPATQGLFGHYSKVALTPHNPHNFGKQWGLFVPHLRRRRQYETGVQVVLLQFLVQQLEFLGRLYCGHVRGQTYCLSVIGQTLLVHISRWI